MNEEQPAIEYEGVWWLPNNPERSVHGHLYIRPGESSNLVCIDLLELPGDIAEEGESREAISHAIKYEQRNYDVILGRVKRSDGAQKVVTLLHSHAFWIDLGPMTQGLEVRITPDFVLVGKHFAELDSVTFTEFEAQFQNLEAWIDFSLHRVNPELDDSGSVSTIHHWFTAPPSPEYTLPQDGGSLSLKIKYEVGLRDPTTYMLAYTIRPTSKFTENASLETHIETMHNFQVLLSILMGRAAYSIGYRGIIVADGTPSELVDVYFHSQHLWVKAKNERTSSKLLTSFQEIQPRMQEIVNTWFGENDKFAQSARLFYDNLHQPNRFTSLRFLTTAQAVETAHRRLYGESRFSPEDVEKYEALKDDWVSDIREGDVNPAFRDSLISKLAFLPQDAFKWRLKDLWRRSQEAIQPFIRDRDDFSQVVGVTRDYFTHYPEIVDDRVASDDELPILTTRLEVLLVATLLLSIGLEEGTVKRALSNFPDFKWILFQTP